MAHSCPRCGCLCHCGGDIDDLWLEGTPEEAACTCCDDDYYDDEDSDYCLACGCYHPSECFGESEEDDG